MKRKDVTVTTKLSYIFEDDEPEPTAQEVVESAGWDKIEDYIWTVGESTVEVIE